MSDAPSPGQPTELQQLEAALAAGAITPELFATLKGKLQPAAPAPVQTPPPAPARVPAPPTEELPSLLDMFSRPPSPAAAPASPEVRPAAPPPVAAGPTAQELAARQRIDEHLARLRQVPAAVAPPLLRPEPPAPVFYPEPLPEPPAPAFYPETPAPVQAVPPLAAPPRARPAAAPVASASASRSWLIVLLLLAVVGGLAYYFTNSSHPDEELTSTKPAATEAPVVAPPKFKATKPAKAIRRTKKRKTKAARTAAPVVASTPDSVQEEEAVADESPAPAPTKPTATTPDFSRPIAAAPEPGDDAAALQVRAAMASYYADLNAPPLHASEHFAPQVERLYIRQNLTPAAIEAELARSFYPDNQHAVSQIEPGTLHVSDLANDGSRTATFVERMRLYRVSLQKYQRLRTQVRVRLNADNKIVYMRQEKLLSNSFEE